MLIPPPPKCRGTSWSPCILTIAGGIVTWIFRAGSLNRNMEALCNVLTWYIYIHTQIYMHAHTYTHIYIHLVLMPYIEIWVSILMSL